MSSIAIAAAQIECRAGKISANLDLHLAVIDEARRLGVDVLVFPELSLTDYLITPDVLALARRPDSGEFVRLSKAAGPMATTVGFIEEAAGAQFYNSMAVLREGQLLHLHRKANLASYGRLEEQKHYARGRCVDIFTIKEPWTASVLICADMWNPALPWLAALQGASLLQVPIASSLGAVSDDFDIEAGWKLNLEHTSLAYGMPVVMANHCGMRGDLRFWGGSCILNARGEEIARAGSEPTFVTARVDFDDVRLARSRLPTVRDADPHFVCAELRRMLEYRLNTPQHGGDS